MNKFIYLILLVVSSLFLSGCWDRYELEERANILGLAIDIADDEAKSFHLPEITLKDDKTAAEEQEPIYKISAQMAIPGRIKLGPEGGGGEGSAETAWVVQTAGTSMQDAMYNLQQQLAEKLYLGHLQIVVVNEEVAEQGLEDINDFLQREYEVRRTAWLMVSKEKAEEVLKASPPIETVPALYLSDTLESSMRNGKLPREYLGRYWVDLSDIGIDAVLPYVKLIENERILIDGLAFFKGDKMVGNMTPFEIGAFLAMKEKNPGGYAVTVSIDEGGTYTLESYRRDSEMKVTVKNGVPSATINVKVEASIDEKLRGGDLTDKKLEEVEKEASRSTEEKFKSVVTKWQEKESDILGLGARIRAKYPKYWSQEVQVAENWGEIFKEMDIDINVMYEIERTGMEYK